MLPRFIVDPSLCEKIYNYCDCIIVGTGIAGLSTAMRISKYTGIKIFTKSSMPESNTWYAQGGIAAVIKKPDMWKNHYEDTIKAGQGLCDRKAVEILVKNAPKMIEGLIEIGVNFDISEGEISLTTEGGHSFPRILHSGGDATGEEIEKKLVNYTKGLKKVEIFTEYFVSDILTYNNRCLGIIGINTNTNTIEIHPASNVVIASGGIGQLYELTTNPSISTGDGIAAAYRAGTEIKDIEFIQFHPTVFKTRDGKLFLISEALRGEGAYLRDCNKDRFMLGKHERAELAPRDIVVKEMVKVMKNTGFDFVYLDATHLSDSLLKIRFPNIISKLKENGLDLKNDLIKISPAAHYLNGGVKTNYAGLTNINGLYCCGEAAATGAHGANRLASNSLIEGLVFGWKIYKDITTSLNEKTEKTKKEIISDIIKLTGKNSKTTLALSKQKKGSKCKKIKDLDIKSLITNFRHMMSEKVGILRDKKSLKDAQDFIDSYISVSSLYNKRDKNTAELVNMLTVAKLIVKAANLREESRGTHQRNDFQEKDDINWKKHIILKKDKFYFEPVK
jgi:L-aspartate oxidase